MKLLRSSLIPWTLLIVSLVAHAVRGGSATPPPPLALAPAAAPKLAEAPAAAPVVAPADVAPEGETGAVRARLQGSPAATFGKAVGGKEGAQVAAAWARLFVWDVDLRRGLHAGDEVAALWELDEAGLPVIRAATLKPAAGATLTAFRFAAPGDRWPSYWTEDGQEVPRRLVNGPLAAYEQITSLLKDRPSHGGIDFKTPVGTQVVSPRAAVVTRSNWNWNANGNCLELRFDDGTIAKFLHLSRNLVEAGATIAKGQAIAETGNTGHSTAPHLHYQLEQGGKVIDPIDYHGVERRKLDGAALAALQQAVAPLARELAGTQVAQR